MEITNIRSRVYNRKQSIDKVKLSAAILVTSLIIAAFYFSSQPASVSRLQSGNILNIFKAFGFENVTMHFVRKLAHFVLFGMIGSATVFAFSFKLSGLIMFRASYLFGTLLGALDEFHQMFVPGRGPQVKDVMIDSLGVFAGVLVVGLIISVYKNKREVKEV
jgi:VanZ family protein